MENKNNNTEIKVNIAKVFEKFKEERLADMSEEKKDDFITKYLYALLRS